MKEVKIVIDLDVVTVAKWKKRDPRRELSEKFLKRVESGEFHVTTPYILIEIVSEWRDKFLVEQIRSFYELHSDKIISRKEFLESLETKKIDYRMILDDLMSAGIKEEDAILVIVAGAFDADVLVTNNRRHLLSKQKEINEVLKNYGLGAIGVSEPGGL